MTGRLKSTPRKFFENFVRRSFEEFRSAPNDEYRAKMAVLNANDMAERMLHYYAGTNRVYGYNVGEENQYRDALAAKECDEFGIVRDVAEGHKHFRLTRRTKTRRVSSAEQTGAKPLRVVNNAGEELTLMNNAGEELTIVTNIIVELNDGSTRPLLPMVENVVAMWDRLSAP